MMNLRTMVVGLTDDLVAKAFMRLWEHDEGTMRVWRASSNFVYRYKNKGNKLYLRFSLEGDQTLGQIEAELDFMNYLAQNGYPTVVPILSMQGRSIERVTTSDGSYIGVVFSDAMGASLDYEQMNGSQLVEWGKSLGNLHVWSKSYVPQVLKRRNWQDVLNDIAAALERHPYEKEAMIELANLSNWLQSLTQSNHEYGLIHYDFQLDNVFWQANHSPFHVIDFDDSMYHWYAMDIVAALADLYDHPERDSSQEVEYFLSGYTEVCPFDQKMREHFPRFLRFSKLYRFSRILTSLENSTMQDTPPWYDGLKIKLITMKDKMRHGFSDPW